MNRPLALFISALVLAFPLSGQQPRVLAPHRAVTPLLPRPKQWHDPAVPRASVGGPWMIDANFKSSISIRNYLAADSLAVTPVLFLSNGRKYTLDTITLEPSGVANVSINDELQRQGISPWSTLVGYVEIDYVWPWDALCVTVSNVDVAHSLIFTYPADPLHQNATSQGDLPQVVEGMWWKNEKEVSGFLALSNISSQSVSTDVQILDRKGSPVGAYSVNVSPHGTKLVQLGELDFASSNEGGVRVTYKGPHAALLVSGGLQDQSSGYSAEMAFAPDDFLKKHDAPITYAEVSLMTGAADPMMAFPSGTMFTPYSVVRNPSSQSFTMMPTVFYMQGATSHSATLPSLTIAPYSTVALDLLSLMASAGTKNINGIVNLQLYVPTESPALLMASGSVDNTHSYVFEVKPQG
jgi:hypothetical protein